jgi:demethylmenaquinone methyltransferase/2-methoxy-6-polyprenyl-1,4-benzoquinol methylase
VTDQIGPDTTRSILDSQRAYYEARADDYGNEAHPDRKVCGLTTETFRRALIDELAPTGDLLELACGNGMFTRELARHASSVTAVDASPRMLELNEERVKAANVSYVPADLFVWQPERRYDVVFFGFWLSHVPMQAFDNFWELVGKCLAPHGRVAFIDEDDRGEEHERALSPEGVAVRRLSSGVEYEIVKIFWRPEDLKNRLASLGWNFEIRREDEAFLYGVGRRTEAFQGMK